MQFNGETALVTGGASGIGKEIVTQLLERDIRVAVLDIDAETGDLTRRDLEAKYGADRLSWTVGTVELEKDVDLAFAAAENKFGAVQMLVNDAGTAALSLIVDTSVEQWDKIVDTCLKGTFLCSRAFAQRLIAKDLPGAIVNISSLNAVAATDGLGHYCAAKAGINQFTQVCAGEFGRYGIRANAIGPGTTRTPLGEGFTVGQMGQEFLDRVLVGPEVRHQEASDIADVALFLLSDAAQRVTGHFIPVDGGQHVRGLHSYWDVAKAQGLV
ncbi:SDR family NAD(P)-dependent oxidoreductase [Gordonia rubripertincta]|uniref:SDR family NAD(P)-dependent oxidoreductase n=1 Tax=Gordonia rubripertincta TaxID=36822 RepID=A0ABT4N3D4_GORRU|nr:SDR family NAD(P)-dependent oxidoreductase [Gordonia rubripertincta]MCZ4552457.1 SDR family NAD(P)-dependent oxidoreductase [Gordonia rubripertincta]